MQEIYLSEQERIRSDKTVEFKRCALSYLEGLRPLGSSEILELYSRMRERVSHSTALAYLMEIRNFYRWLKDRGYNLEFSDRALSQIRARKELKGQSRKYFTEEEVESILSYIRHRPFHPIYYVFTVFLLCSGLRLSEALAVEKSDVQVRRMVSKDGQMKSIYLVKVKGKFSKEREVPLYFWKESYKELWDNFFSQAQQSLWLYKLEFPKNYKIIKLSRHSVLKTYQTIEKALGFPVNAHRFRFTFATWLATKGVPPNLIRELLGHSSIKTTMEVYAQAQREKLLEILFA